MRGKEAHRVEAGIGNEMSNGASPGEGAAILVGGHAAVEGDSGSWPSVGCVLQLAGAIDQTAPINGV